MLTLIQLYTQHSIYVKQIFHYQKYEHEVSERLFGIIRQL